jgi:hypothetical protein
MVSLCLSVLAPLVITQVFPALVGFNVPLRGERAVCVVGVKDGCGCRVICLEDSVRGVRVLRG